MCIVPDAPILIPMLKPSDPAHEEFAPVLLWVRNGRGKFVVGGSKWKQELRAVRSILQPLQELERRGKIVFTPDAEVDAEVQVVKDLEPRADFDDPHLVALVRLTGCRLVCLRDPRAHRFLRDTRLYDRSTERPSLYTGMRNSRLLRDQNIAPCCR